MHCKTIHVITVHWPTSDWVGVQLQQLSRYVAPPGRFLAILPDGVVSKFDVEISSPEIARDAKFSSVSHWHNLNALTDVVVSDADDDDVLLAIDGDAFPIGDLRPLIEDALFVRKLGALSIEMSGRPRPLIDRPTAIFCAVRIGLWRKLGVGWQMMERHVIAPGGSRRLYGIRDTAGQLIATLIKRNLGWRCLKRTNSFELSWPRFGIYGDVVYHHGQAFRGAQTYNMQRKVVVDLWGESSQKEIMEKILHYSDWLGAAVQSAVIKDVKFIRRFI